MKPIDNLVEQFDSLDLMPQPIYFLNEKGEVAPKRIFTITRKQINWSSQTVEVFVKELNTFVEFVPGKIVGVNQCFVN